MDSKDRHDVRAEIAHQGIRGLILINGGACIAVLGFLQAFWKIPGEPPLLVSWLFWSLPLYALGVFCGGFVFIPRYKTSLRYEQKREKSAKRFETFSWSLQIGSMVCFLLGTIVIVIGGFRMLKGL